MKKKYIPIIILLILISGCATQKQIIQEETVSLQIPPGVDSLTTVIADSIFSQVSITEEEKKIAKQEFDHAQYIWDLGDSLWDTAQKDTLSHQDSIRALHHILEAQEYVRQDKESYKTIKKSQKKLGKLHNEVLKSISTVLMTQAISNYETAIQQNRFEVSFRQKLFQNLQTIYQRTKDKSYLKRAADEMEKVVTDIKDNHSFYYQLAERYFQLIDWEKAFKNYEKATKTLREAAIFNISNPELYLTRPNEVPLDTTTLVNYIYRQAQCKARLYEDTLALALFKEAQQITPSIELRQNFQEWIDWILWDDGNIRASEIRDKADTLRREEKYIAAKNVYLTLLSILRTKRTDDEINWRIAVIDYFRIDNKPAGLNRMQQVIKYSATDSITGAPIDSAYIKYFDNFGTMCYNSAAEYLDMDLTKAYVYFTQAAETYNKEQGRAYLQLAALSDFDPSKTIHICDKAKKYLDSLDLVEKKLLYELYYRSYRKLGDFAASKEWYDQWKNL